MQKLQTPILQLFLLFVFVLFILKINKILMMLKLSVNLERAAVTYKHNVPLANACQP